MNYLLSHLTANERPIAKTRKSACIFLREVLVLIILGGVIAGFFFGMKWPLASKEMYMVYGGCGLVFLVFLSLNIASFISTALLVTTHKFMYKEDIVAIKVFDTQLQNIDAIEVDYKTIFHRMFNYGHITISTRNTKQTFKNMSHPDLFSARLNKQSAKVSDSRTRRVNVTFGIGPNGGAKRVARPPVNVKAVTKKN